jgi:hypothetical protein
VFEAVAEHERMVPIVEELSSAMFDLPERTLKQKIWDLDSMLLSLKEKAVFFLEKAPPEVLQQKRMGHDSTLETLLILLTSHINTLRTDTIPTFMVKVKSTCASSNCSRTSSSNQQEQAGAASKTNKEAVNIKTETPTMEALRSVTRSKRHVVNPLLFAQSQGFDQDYVGPMNPGDRIIGRRNFGVFEYEYHPRKKQESARFFADVMSHYFEGTGKGLSGWIDSSMKDDVDFVLFVEMLRSNEFQKFATFFVEQPAVAQLSRVLGSSGADLEPFHRLLRTLLGWYGPQGTMNPAAASTPRNPFPGPDKVIVKRSAPTDDLDEEAANDPSVAGSSKTLENIGLQDEFEVR